MADCIVTLRKQVLSLSCGAEQPGCSFRPASSGPEIPTVPLTLLPFHLDIRCGNIALGKWWLTPHPQICRQLQLVLYTDPYNQTEG